jgi:outer membrane protein
MSFQKRACQLAAACLLGLALPIITLAQAPGTAVQKICVVDTEKILTSSSAGKAFAAEMTQRQKDAESRIGAIQQQIQDLRNRISDGGASLSAENLANLKKELEGKTTEFTRARDDATRELEKLRDSGLASLEKKIMPVINQVAKELGYTFIFRKYDSGLIYADEATDISELIVRRMDAPGS